MQESEIARSRDRFQKAENKEQSKNHIDMKMKKVIWIAKDQTFNNLTLLQFSQFERVQMKTTMSNKMMNSKTVLAVHRVDSASGRRRKRDKRWKRSREQEQKRREREQSVSK
jgi:hypothetical protein